jgi:surface antigen
MPRYRKIPTVAAALLAALSLPALCDPPSHAPAHGWRKKNDPYYVGYTGRKWRDDFGVASGRCDAARLGAELGASAGAGIGAAVGGDTGAVIGAIAGVLIGARADERMQPVDRGCVSHALDIGADNRPVTWTNPDSGERYTVTPRAMVRKNGQNCRELDWSGGVRQTVCLAVDGGWVAR